MEKINDLSTYIPEAYKDICVTAIAIAGIQQLEQIVKELSGKVDELESRLL